MKNKKNIILAVIFLISGFLVQKTDAQVLTIKYGYAGNFGGLRIADDASAYLGSKMVARAWALEIVKQTDGPNHILIKEHQFDSFGGIIYQGTLEIEFGVGGGKLIKDTCHFGKKKYYVFASWPCGA
jgi:hypothetical protein